MKPMTNRRAQTDILPLAALSRSERATLNMLEMDWPDSIGLMARVAQHTRAHAPSAGGESDRALAMVRAGLRAYRESWNQLADDTERFAAFVDGITHSVPREQQHCVAKSLSTTQRWVLARRLPPGYSS